VDELTAAIENFYNAFADVPRPEHIDGCSHCIDDKGIETLLSLPLRELTPDHLSSYASSAFLTVGDVADYLYFLPRIIEISIREESWWPDLEVTARAIRDSGYASWSVERRAALGAVLKAFLTELIDTETYSEIDGLMCAIGVMDIDVHPYLAIIERNPKAVLEFWEANAGKLHEGKLGNHFWDPPTLRHDHIVVWFRSDKIRRIYFDAYGYKPGE